MRASLCYIRTIVFILSPLVHLNYVLVSLRNVKSLFFLTPRPCVFPSPAGETVAAPTFAAFHASASAQAKDRPSLAEASSIIQQKISQLGSGAELAEVGRWVLAPSPIPYPPSPFPVLLNLPAYFNLIDKPPCDTLTPAHNSIALYPTNFMSRNDFPPPPGSPAHTPLPSPPSRLPQRPHPR